MFDTVDRARSIAVEPKRPQLPDTVKWDVFDATTADVASDVPPFLERIPRQDVCSRMAPHFSQTISTNGEDSQVCAMIRRHHDQVQQRLDAFLAHEEKLAKHLLDSATHEWPSASSKSQNREYSQLDQDQNQDYTKPYDNEYPQPHAISTLDDNPRREPTTALFTHKEFEENEWKPKEGAASARSATMRLTEMKLLHRRKNHAPAVEGSLQSKAIQLVCSPNFDLFFLTVIVINSVVMGSEVQIDATRGDAQVQNALGMVQTSCSILFMFELFIRLYADRLYFFYANQWAWNCFDFILVASSTMELGMALMREVIGTPLSGAKTLSTARILRILRVTRIARSIRFVRALRILLLSIFSTLKTLGFALVLVVLVIYFYGVILTQAVASHLKEVPRDEPLLTYYWGDLFKSMLTLFYCISGGVDWAMAMEPLLGIHGFYGFMLTTYVIIMFFAVLNAITGAFCQGAADSQMHDRELQLHDLLKCKKGELRHLSGLFEKIFKSLDTDGSGDVDIDEFTTNIAQDTVQELLDTLELQPEDAWAFFRLLDKDESGNLDVDEFVSTCLRLKGSARSIDLAKCTYDQKIMRKQNLLFMQHVVGQLTKIRSEVSTCLGAVGPIGRSGSIGSMGSIGQKITSMQRLISP